MAGLSSVNFLTLRAMAPLAVITCIDRLLVMTNKTPFLKPKYGDASGVRGAAILSRQNSI